MFGAAPFGWIYPAGMIAADIGAPVGPTIPVEQPGGGGGWGFESTRRKKPRNAFHFIQDLQFVDSVVPEPISRVAFEHASEASAVSEAVHQSRQPRVGMPRMVAHGRPHGSQSSLGHTLPQLTVSHESRSHSVSTHRIATQRYWTEEDDVALDDMMVLMLASGYMDS